jgi:pimeloyl-ACP methyl ester carboxylesterase
LPTFRKPTTEGVDVRGARIAVDVWPRTPCSRGAVVLVHGGAAHRGWWRPVAELLSETHDVVTMDLSGHGDSGRRDAYDFQLWTAELEAVASTFCEDRPVAVGHSMGGLVVAHAAAHGAGALRAVIAIDSPLRPRPEEVLARRRRSASTPPRYWADQQEAVESFAPVPPAAPHAAMLVREIAFASFRRAEQGWTSKLDPRVFLRSDLTPTLLSKLEVPATWIRCAEGLIDEEHAQELRSHLTGRGTVIDLPEAGHHVILDEPKACAWLIASTVAHMNPRR